METEEAGGARTGEIAAEVEARARAVEGGTGAEEEGRRARPGRGGRAGREERRGAPAMGEDREPEGCLLREEEGQGRKGIGGGRRVAAARERRGRKEKKGRG